jgi:hypothetical protein
MKKAYKKTYDFAVANPDLMFAEDCVDDIENPEYDTIAECTINGEQIYLWQDHCWGIAVDKNGKEILKRTMPITFNLKVAIETTSMLLFQIGIAPVE